MSTKSQRNQQFSTLDLILMVILCGAVSSVLGASIAGVMHDTRPVRARSASEAFALQIKQQMSNSATRSSSRAPASEEVPPLTAGEIGRDPWGRPYHYSVLSSEGAVEPVILVWSNGANGQVESAIDGLTQTTANAFKFTGDDVGFIHYAAAMP